MNTLVSGDGKETTLLGKTTVEIKAGVCIVHNDQFFSSLLAVNPQCACIPVRVRVVYSLSLLKSIAGLHNIMQNFASEFLSPTTC